MRKITKQAVEAFHDAKPFKKSDTEIKVLPNVTVMELFGSPIAYRYNDPDRTLSVTLAGWSSPAAMERLNGIDGVSVHKRRGVTYLNGTPWDGSLIDIEPPKKEQGESKLYPRKCSQTGEGMEKGWYCEGCGKYFKYKLHAAAHAIGHGFKDMDEAYKDGFMYYTEWEELDEDENYLLDGTLVEAI